MKVSNTSAAADLATASYSKISFIESIPPDEIFFKTVCREEEEWSEHSHSKHQLIYTVSGTLHVTVGQERHFVAAKHLVWIPAGIQHRLSSNNAQVSLLVCCFTLNNQATGSAAIFVANEFVSYNLSFLAKHGIIAKRQKPELFGFAVNLLNLVPQVCQRATFSLQPFFARKTDRLYPILNYIDKNYAKDLSVASVADRFALSVRNLTRMFTNADIRFVAYLNHARIVRALELLADKEMSIEQISYKVGFSSPTSFNRVFKKITGNAPSYYFLRDG